MKQKHSVNDINIDMKTVAKEVIIGPKSKLVRKLEELNRNFITSSYVYGNRSLLAPLKPLGVTKTYRWQAGYKDIVTSVINDRFDQYSKKSGNLHTLLISRPSRMEWTKKRFIKAITEVDKDMQELRKRKITMEDTTEKSIEFFERVISTIQEKDDEAREFFSHYPDLDYDLYFVGHDIPQDERYRNRIDCDATYNNNMEILKYETYNLVLDIHMKKPEIIVRSSEDGVEKEVGRVPMDDTYITFEVPLKSIINALYTQDIGSITTKNIKGFADTDNYILRECGISQDHYRFSNGYYQSKAGNLLKHPFISATGDFSNDDLRFNKWFSDEDVPYHIQNVCFGNMGDEIEEAFVNLDFMYLMMLLVKWQTYVCGRTTPLNNINESFLTIPEDKYSVDFLKTIGAKTNMMQGKLLELFGASPYIATRVLGGGNMTDHLFRWDKETSWGDRSYENRAIDWYRREYNVDYNDILHFGWDFYINGWVPNKSQMGDIICIYDMIEETEQYSFDWIFDQDDDEEIKHLLIQFYQEYQIALVQALTDYLDSENCRTRDNKFYQNLTIFLGKVYDNTKVQDEVEQKTNQARAALNEAINSIANTPEGNPDLPFGNDDEDDAFDIEGLDEYQIQELDSDQAMMDRMDQQMINFATRRRREV